MLHFVIPDSENLTPINIKLLRLIKEYPDLFYDDFDILSAYGCPCNCIWNGGTTNFGISSNKATELVLRKYKENNVEYWFTFTNRLLKPEHLLDAYGNSVLKIAEASGETCRVLVASDIMENYIREKHPNFKIVQSVCRCEYDLDKINEMSEKDITVLPIRHNNDFEGSLAKLTHPENIEILTDEGCVENCPYNRLHYESFNRFVLRETDTFARCKYTRSGKDYRIRKHYVPRELYPKYEAMGITHMKISGRNLGKEIIPEYLDVFVRPEYKDIIGDSLNNFNEKRDWDWGSDAEFLEVDTGDM